MKERDWKKRRDLKLKEKKQRKERNKDWLKKLESRLKKKKD